MLPTDYTVTTDQRVLEALEKETIGTKAHAGTRADGFEAPRTNTLQAERSAFRPG